MNEATKKQTAKQKSKGVGIFAEYPFQFLVGKPDGQANDSSDKLTEKNGDSETIMDWEAEIKSFKSIDQQFPDGKYPYGQVHK